MLVEMIKTKNVYLDADAVDDFRSYMGKGGRKSNKKNHAKENRAIKQIKGRNNFITIHPTIHPTHPMLYLLFFLTLPLNY